MTAPLIPFVNPTGERKAGAGYLSALKGAPRSSFVRCRAPGEREGGGGARAAHSRKSIGEDCILAYTGRPRVILSLLPEAPPRLINSWVVLRQPAGFFFVFMFLFHFLFFIFHNSAGYVVNIIIIYIQIHMIWAFVFLGGNKRDESKRQKKKELTLF